MEVSRKNYLHILFEQQRRAQYGAVLNRGALFVIDQGEQVIAARAIRDHETICVMDSKYF